MKRALSIGGLGILLITVIAGYFVWKERSVQQPLEQQATVQDEDKDLLGEWSLYMDCPNTIFTFKEGGTTELENCDSDSEATSNEIGTYTVAGENILATFPESGDYPFVVIYEGSEQKLRLVRFDQEFVLFKVQR